MKNNVNKLNDIAGNNSFDFNGYIGIENEDHLIYVSCIIVLLLAVI